MRAVSEDECELCEVLLHRTTLPTLRLIRDVKQGAKVRSLIKTLFASRRLTNAPCSKDAPTNPRGIPQAPFVDKVDDYVSSRAEVDGTMKSFQEMISYAVVNRMSIDYC